MLLAVDIGNTNIKIALFKGHKIIRRFRLVTEKKDSLRRQSRLLKKIFGQQKTKGVDDIVICSVVPRISRIFQKALQRQFHKRPLLLGQDLIAPIKNLYRKPKQVGQDRLANAVAAFSKYGGPLIILDFGTALTFDVVSKNGSYLGGVIAPGMELALKDLTDKAELLPKVRLGRPQELIGRDTVTSIKSGMVYGYGFLVQGILAQLKKKMGPATRIIATGGKAPLMQSYCRAIKMIDLDLTLKGLFITYKKRNNRLKKGKNC
ncbi:type III pantothenate kinase [Candidatus Omnitrophota bacterium]